MPPCSTVTLLGDSVIREVFKALVMALTDDEEPAVEDLGMDYRFIGPNGLNVTFLWMPYERQLPTILSKWREAKQTPDLFVTGPALWHIKHKRNRTDYERKLRGVRDAWQQLVVEVVCCYNLLHPRVFATGTTRPAR